MLNIYNMANRQDAKTPSKNDVVSHNRRRFRSFNCLMRIIGQKS